MEEKDTYTRYKLKDLSTDDGFEIEYLPDKFRGANCNPFEPHSHSYYQCIWFKSGGGSHYVDFKKYPVSDDILFFISPGQIHQFCDDSKNAEGVIINFNESFLSDERSSETVFLKYNMFNSFDSVPYFHVCKLCHLNLQHIIGDIEMEMNRKNEFGHADCMRMLVRMFLIEVQRMGERGAGRRLQIVEQSSRTFVKFRQMLERHYRHIHTVKEYAGFLNVSPKTLTDYTQECAHTTPLEMINDRIILEARRLLRHSSLKVKEIAYFLGFDDPSYFVKFFKRYAGRLPIDYRNTKSPVD